MPLRALVLSGGNALGAYHAGAYQALHDAGEQPDWIAGSSIGAITAALIAGNPPERRIERLQEFWRRATAPDLLPWTQASRWLAALQTRLLGRPGLFHARLPLGGDPARAALYDAAPLRRCLEDLVDFTELNAGRVRVSVLAVDVATAEEVVFDTGAMTLGADHLLASAALIPDFPPVRIGDRWLADGGLAANTPIDLVLGTPPAGPVVCFAAELFSPDAPVPRDVGSLSMRQGDLTFTCQTERTLRALAAIDRCGPKDRPAVDVVRIAHAPDADEPAMKGWDFSDTALRRRWGAGHADMVAALQRFRAMPMAGAGLRIHPVVRA